MTQYYAAARDQQGRIRLLLVTVGRDCGLRQEWTGIVYRTNRAAAADLTRRNREIAARATAQA